MKHAKILGLVALAATSGMAHAGPYLGGGAALTEYRYDDVELGAGLRGFVGYRFEGLPLIVEAGYVDFGEADVESFPGLSLGFTGAQVSIGYFAALSASGNSGLWLKGGYYDGDAELEGLGSSTERSSSGATVSVGGDWMFLPWIGLRAEVENFFNVKDFAKFQPDHEDNVTVASLNLVFEVPMTQRRTAAAEPAAAPAPVYVQPAYVAQPAPVPAPAPKAQARAPAPVGSVAVLPATTALRDQPRPDGPIAAQLSAGNRVTLRSLLNNASGAWWFVHSDAGIGWIEASTIE